MSYQEWRRQVAATILPWGPFWEIIDANWTPEEQNVLAREWKERSSS